LSLDRKSPHWRAWRCGALLLAAACGLSACCTPVAEPGTVQPGSGSCGAYFTIANAPSAGGAANR
jgi:hypothetical protein